MNTLMKAAFLSAFMAISNPVEAKEIEVHNPDAKGNKTRIVDCDNIVTFNKRSYPTCDFVEQVDGQEICNDKDYEIGGKFTEQSAANILTVSFQHNVDTHDQCTAQYASVKLNVMKALGVPREEQKAFYLDMKQKREEISKEGKDPNLCVVHDAVNQCMQP